MSTPKPSAVHQEPSVGSLAAFRLNHNLTASLLLAAIVCALFAPILRHDFVGWDDRENIYTNQYLLKPSLANTEALWTHAYKGLYLPLTGSLMAGIASIAQTHPQDAATAISPILLNPHYFHFASLLVHLANSLLVFAIFFRLTKSTWPSFFGALLFAIHPLQVETVAWASGFDRPTCALFGFASLLCYIESVQKQQPESWRLDTWMGLALALGLLADFAKPVAIVLPLVAFVIDAFLLRATARRRIGLCAAWLVAGTPIILISQWATASGPAMNQPTVLFWQRFVIAGDALLFYIGKLVLPLRLAIDYGRTPTVVLAHWWAYANFAAAILLTISLFALLRKGRFPWITVGLLVWLINLVPVLGLVSYPFQRFSNVSDRYVYLAMLGPSLIVAFALNQVKNWRPVLTASLAAVSCIYALSSARQVTYWRNTETLMLHCLSVNPRSDAACNNLSVYYHESGRNDLAVTAAKQALSINPHQEFAHFNLGQALWALGDKNDAIIQYLAQNIVNPNNAACHFNLANAYAESGRLLDAITQYRLAIALQPDLTDAHVGLGAAYGEAGRLDLATLEFEAALKIDPSNAAAQRDLALAQGAGTR